MFWPRSSSPSWSTHQGGAATTAEQTTRALTLTLMTLLLVVATAATHPKVLATGALTLMTMRVCHLSPPKRSSGILALVSAHDPESGWQMKRLTCRSGLVVQAFLRRSLGYVWTSLSYYCGGCERDVNDGKDKKYSCDYFVLTHFGGIA